MTFAVERLGTMFDAMRHDDELAGFDNHIARSQSHFHPSGDDEE